MLETNTVIEIPFHDVDMMGIAWHGHYAKYFEVARCELLDLIDYNYRQMEATGFAWPVIDMRIQYVKPASFGMKINVNARLLEYENRLKVAYVITERGSGRKLTKGYSCQVAVNMAEEEMCLVSPACLLEKIQAAEAALA